MQSYEQLFPTLTTGELLYGTEDLRFKDAWDKARPDSFAPVS